MLHFFRVQHKGYSFAQMCEHASEDGGDASRAGGLCVTMSASGGSGGRFGGAWDAMDDDDELVILEGRIIEEIYDGYRIQPTREIARFTIAEWAKMLEDGSAYDYESYI